MKTMRGSGGAAPRGGALRGGAPRGGGLLLGAAALAVLAVSLFIGSTAVPAGDVLRGLTGASDPAAREAARIVLDLRLPLSLAAFLCGGALAVAGTALQGALRNPLAEPYLLGVSSGGALGLVLAGAVGLGSFWGRTGLAFALGLGATGAVLTVAHRARLGWSPTGVILAGVAMSAALSAAVMVLQSLLAPWEFRASVGLLMGQVGLLSRGELAGAALVIAATCGWLWYRAPELDLLSLGRETAAPLGLAPDAALVGVAAAASLAAAVSVALCGVIGFVGLVAPHAARFLVGARHGRLVPHSFVAGGLFLLVAETVTRSLASVAELPVGAVTAVIGVPCFFWILRRHGRDA